MEACAEEDQRTTRGSATRKIRAAMSKKEAKEERVLMDGEGSGGAALKIQK